MNKPITVMSQGAIRIFNYRARVDYLFALFVLSAGLSTAGSLDNWYPRATGASNVITALSHGDGRFVAVDEIPNDTNSTSFLLISTNGQDWLRQSARTNLQAQGLAIGKGVMLTATPIDIDGNCYLMLSTNGSNWIAQNLTGPVSIECDDGVFAAIGRRMVIGIPPTPPAAHCLWRSTNGFHWQETFLGYIDSLGDFLTQGQFEAGNGVSVVVATLWHYGQPSKAFWRSTNELDWTQRISPPMSGPYLSRITFGHGRFVGIYGSSILTSADGETWTYAMTQPPGTAGFSDITYGAGHFVVVGQQGVILTSSDGFDWTLRNSGTVSNLTGVEFGNHTFLAWGSGATVLQSDPLVHLQLDYNTNVLLTLSGPSGSAYRIEYLSDLNPTNSWQVLTNLALPYTPYTWTDDQSPTESPRFYRAVMLAP